MEVRLRIAQKERVLGGWELFPFYSQADGLSGKLEQYCWLKGCFVDSIDAILRFAPKTLLVSSQEGYDVVTKTLLNQENWMIEEIEHNPKPVCVAYCRPKGKRTEVFAIRWQILSQPPVSYDVILQKFLDLRRRYEE